MSNEETLKMFSGTTNETKITATTFIQDCIVSPNE